MTKFLGSLLSVVTCCVCAVFIPTSSVCAQSTSPLIQNVANRKTISLSGDWHYLADPHEEGTARRYYLNGKPFGSRNFVEYDFNTAPTLRVPADWNFQLPELQLYEGTVWYQKSFDCHPRRTRGRFFISARRIIGLVSG